VFDEVFDKRAAKLAKIIVMVGIIFMLFVVTYNVIFGMANDMLNPSGARRVTRTYAMAFVDAEFGGVIDEDYYSVVLVSGGFLFLSTRSEVTLNNAFFSRFQSFLADKGHVFSLDELSRISNAGFSQSQLRQMITLPVGS
jgi:hypothetical protein